MTLHQVIVLINHSEIRLADIPEAKTILRNEIDYCGRVMADACTQPQMRIEYQQKVRKYSVLLQKIT